jgi:putative spermidine/putrescine transport system ATP-binding protein
MSNRLAVFSEGRIQQVGSPADVYEHPATSFVAGFVGTSNLMTGATAEAVIGSTGTYTVRPEKIRIGPADADPAPDEQVVRGRVREVIYLGPDTRYVVSLDVGGELVVTRQNLETSSMEALTAQGEAVGLFWKRHHVLHLAEGNGEAGEAEERSTT